jgi:hypothetical protein
MAKRNRLWGFDDAERALLAAATVELPTLRAVIARAGAAARSSARSVGHAGQLA